jgi:hypothetical protein
MPVTYAFEDDVLALRLAGVYAIAEIRAALLAALAEPDRRPIAGLLLDFRKSVSVATRTLGEMTASTGFLAYHAAHFGSRVAMLVATDAEDTLMRMATVDLGTAGLAASVFSDPHEARRWLSP